MSQSPPIEVPLGGMAEMSNKHQADPVCENVEPTSPVSSCVSMKSNYSMDPPLKFQEEPSSIPRVEPTSPVLSCMSMKSNHSMDPPLKFQEEPSSIPSVEPTSPVSSCVSMKSNYSMDPPLKFQEEPSSIPRLNPNLPVPRCLSMKSDRSMEPPDKFKRETLKMPRPIRQARSHTSAPKCVSSMERPSSFNRSSGIEPTSPVSSCVSMKSNYSMDPPLKFQEEPSSIPSVEPTSPVSSCVSMKSNYSMDPPLKFQEEPSSIPRLHPNLPVPSCLSMKSDRSMEPPDKFKRETSKMPRPIRQARSHTSAPKCVSSMERPSSFNRSSGCSTLPDKELCTTLKSILKNRSQWLSGVQGYGDSTPLNDIYTELYVTEGESGEVNNEHEVRQIEIASRIHPLTEDKPIKCNDIFKPLQGQDTFIRTVLTKGIAGIGKTVSVQKFILDWAEGTANQDIHFIFPLPFRELNLMKDQCFSLEGLVHHFFPPLKQIKFTNVTTHNTVFIFDGLDEHRLPLDFQNSMVVSEATITTSVAVLLTNLIKGNLLPSALIWITSRPAAASQIPHEWISQVTEIRGFNNPQKEEFLRKNIHDKSLVNEVIKHLVVSRSLYIMCHVPVFCWISATVLEKTLKEAEGKAIPKTLTQMYTHFLIIQTRIRREKYHEGQERNDGEMIIKLGELAFRQLLKGNLIFYEEDLKECGINVKDAVQYSGVCTQIFREESELSHSQGKVFCFVHLSIQEHLAGLYVHIAFNQGNNTVLNQWNPTKRAILFPCLSLAELHKSAVDKALQSKSGEFDLFLRFLLGISQESNQALLQELLPEISPCSSQSVQDTIEYIKIRLRMNLNPEKYINLFHCLNELNDLSLVEEIQNFQESRRLAKTKLSPSQWSALVFVLLTSGNPLDVFDLRKYSMDNTDECLQRMLPVVMASRTAEVRNCNLSDKGYKALTSALSSKSLSLRELKLNGNVLHQSGIKILSEGLQNPHCKLEILELSDCAIQAEDCKFLFSGLSLNLSHLRELDLSFNPIGTFGIFLLSDTLQKPQCRLKTLKLFSCHLNSQDCAYLAAVLKNNSSLIELDLSKNRLKYYGADHLSNGLRNPSCKLSVLSVCAEKLSEFLGSRQTLASFIQPLTFLDSESWGKQKNCQWINGKSLADCDINSDGCRSLCNALRSNPSHLRQLCLNRNLLMDRGIQHIADFLKKPCCKLEKLSLSYCSVTEHGCTALASALALNPSHLKELELTGNKPGNSGRERLSTLQQHKDYRLEKLKL